MALSEARKRIAKLEDREATHFRLRDRYRYRLERVLAGRDDPGSASEGEDKPEPSSGSKRPKRVRWGEWMKQV